MQILLLNLLFVLFCISYQNNVCNSGDSKGTCGSQLFPIKQTSYKSYAFLVSCSYSKPEKKKILVDSENYDYFMNVKHETEGRKDLFILKDALTETKNFKKVKVAHATPNQRINKQFIMDKIDSLFNRENNATLIYLSGQVDNKTGKFLVESRFDGIQQISLNDIYTKWVSRKQTAMEFCQLILDFSSAELWIEQLKNVSKIHKDLNFSIYAATKINQTASTTEFGSVFTKNIVTMLSNKEENIKYFERRLEANNKQNPVFFGFQYKVYNYFGLPLFLTTVQKQEQFLKKTGLVLFTYKDSAVYEGEVAYQNSSGIKREGLGIFRYSKGNGMYEGEWLNDKKHGKGVLHFKKGSRYEGEFQNGDFNGYGYFYNYSGDMYAGQWKDDKQHGHGFLMKTSKETYDGDWFKGKRQGKGKLYYSNGNFYEGEFYNNELHGQGVFKWAPGKNQVAGDQYEGQYVNGLKHGKGVLKFTDGAVYTGEFKDNLYHGKGHYIWGEGKWHKDEYYGDWKNDNRTGNGTYTYANGNKYEGEFLESLRHGKGKFFWSNTRNTYEGDWLDDQMHGRGLFTYVNGDKEEGEYRRGKKIGKHRKITVKGVDTYTVY